MIRRAASLVLAAAGAAAVLAGCTDTIHLDPAADANDPVCAEVSVRMPDAIADQSRVWTDAQATAAWGDDSGTNAIFTCGLEPPAPSTLQCVTFGGVDWIVDDAEFPNLRMTTYGRTPAAQVYVNTEIVTGDDALSAVSAAAQRLPQDGRCTTADEATVVPPDEDAPTTSGG